MNFAPGALFHFAQVPCLPTCHTIVPQLTETTKKSAGSGSSASGSDNDDCHSVAYFESVSAQNKEWRMISLDSLRMSRKALTIPATIARMKIVAVIAVNILRRMKMPPWSCPKKSHGRHSSHWRAGHERTKGIGRRFQLYLCCSGRMQWERWKNTNDVSHANRICDTRSKELDIVQNLVCMQAHVRDGKRRLERGPTNKW